MVDTQHDCLIRVHDVQRWFGPDQVLKNIQLECPRGTVTALLGRNGCGKSTLMKILAGLLLRDGGSVEVLGCDPECFQPSDIDRFAYVTDSSSIWPTTKLGKELSFIRELRGDSWDELQAQTLIKKFGLPLEKRWNQLSLGMQARAKIIFALAANPELLILDEPAQGLDLFARKDLLESLIDVVEMSDRGVLITSHLIDDVERIADRVAFLRHGEISVCGDIEELRNRYRKTRFELENREDSGLKAALTDLIGVERFVQDPVLPPNERQVLFNDFSQSLVSEIEKRANVRAVETRRLSLRDIYFEILSGEEEGMA